MLEPLAIGNWILKADVSDDSRMRKISGRTGVSVARGTSSAKVSAPSAMTARMYQRPAAADPEQSAVSISRTSSCHCGRPALTMLNICFIQLFESTT